MTHQQPIKLLDNSRFYILVTSILLSFIVAAYLRLTLPGDQLYYIRLQQVFGFMAIAYWYVAMIISPLGYTIGKERTKRLEFARRAIGVSAAYFALLHTIIALWGQIGGLQNILLLPPLFQWSIIGGGLALIVLLLMAATSLDKVITFMTFRKWKWLHRFVYLAGILAILHIWTIGTHLTHSWIQWVSFGALALLFGLESFRITTLLARKYNAILRKDYFFMTVTTIWIAWILLIASIPLFVQNYHSDHPTANTQSAGYKEHHD